MSFASFFFTVRALIYPEFIFRYYVSRNSIFFFSTWIADSPNITYYPHWSTSYFCPVSAWIYSSSYICGGFSWAHYSILMDSVLIPVLILHWFSNYLCDKSHFLIGQIYPHLGSQNYLWLLLVPCLSTYIIESASPVS